MLRLENASGERGNPGPGYFPLQPRRRILVQPPTQATDLRDGLLEPAGSFESGRNATSSLRELPGSC